MTKLPRWMEEKPGHPLQNWSCKCGRVSSMEHQVNGLCIAKDKIERLEQALSIAWNTLSLVNEWQEEARAYKIPVQPQEMTIIIGTVKDAMRRIEALPEEK